MRRAYIGFVALTMLAAFAVAASAQQRRITGRVTDLGSGEPLPGASIEVVGTPFGAVANDEGRYSVAAPEGDVQLQVRRIGYRRRVVSVPSGIASADVALERDVLRLEEQIITGEATTVARRNAANDIALVNTEELNRAPAQTIESAMQGKVAGATIQANSGAPGGGLQIQLRGVTTINAAVDPLFVVDGVMVSNEAIASGANAITAAAAGGNASNQDNPTSRIADLNPNDIERIEILKGASASAIYGAKAANGVIIITTKRGEAGTPRYNVTQRIGTSMLSNKFGTRAWELDDALATFARSAADSARVTAELQNGADDIEEGLFGEQPLSYETQLSAGGGTEQTRLYLSGLYKHDGGIMKNTGYTKRGLRANLTQLVGSRLTLDVQSNLTHSLAQRGITNNDNAGVSHYMVLPFTPSFADIRPVGGIYPENPYERSNPYQTRDLVKSDENVYRFLGSGSLKYSALTTPRHSLSLQLEGGADHFTQRNELYSPPELEFEDDDGEPGTSVFTPSEGINSNWSLNAVHSWFSTMFTATTSAGLQHGRQRTILPQVLASNMFAGQQNPDQASTLNAFYTRQLVNNVAWYAQEEVLAFDERVFLTLGLRAERNSNNGDADRFFFYPKGSVSFRLPAFTDLVSELKLRAAAGQSGNQPLYGMKFTSAGTGTYSGGLGLFSGDVAGNPDIEPERQTEIELGFDATVWRDRLGLAFTVYQKDVDNLILQRQAAPSTGYLTELFNGAAIRNRGIEIALALTPVQSPRATWVSRTTFSRNYSVVTDSGGLPAFNIGGFGTSLGAFQIRHGRSATQIIGFSGSNVVQIGDAAPTFQLGFANTFTMGVWRLSALLDWKSGGDVINLTQLLYDAGANSPDYEDAGATRISTFGTNTKLYVQDAGYVKLRELAIAYELPSAVAPRVFGARARAARLELAGRNLLTWADYPGVDPEVSNFGNQAIARNIDVAPYPPSRSIFLTLSVDY